MSKKKKKLRLSDHAVNYVNNKKKSYSIGLQPYVPPEGVIGDEQITNRANDSIYNGGLFGNFNITNDPSIALYEEGLGFPGYPYLSRLSERAEYRMVYETRTEEMLRKGWEFKYIDNEDKEAKSKLKEIEEAFASYNIKELLREHLNADGLFGISHIGILFKNSTDDELQTPLFEAPEKIKKGSLKAFKIINPIWVTPVQYETIDPMDEYFYNPSMWWVLGKQYHSSRLITLVSQPVPDMLKPYFNFGGVSLSFMCKPYVDNWLRTRQSVSDIIHNFSLFVIKTDLEQNLQGGCNDILKRLDLFNAFRDNQGVALIDNKDEDISNISAPLSNLDHLQAQSQEHLASVSGIPLVKLLGVTPSGLNASSDGEIRCFYDKIASLQERMLRPTIKRLLNIIQLHLFGEIDTNITFDFNPLWQLDDVQKSQVNTEIVRQITELRQQNIISNEDATQAITNADLPQFTDLKLETPPSEFQGNGLEDYE